MKHLRLLVALCCGLGLTTFADVTLTGDTSEPNNSTFVPGEEVLLKFRILGLPSDTKEVLTVDVVDDQGRVVKDYSFPLVAASNEYSRVRYSDDMGNSNFLWKVDVRVPTNRLGFFQAFAKLSSGETLPSVSSRPAGYLTYAIVPDPFERKKYPARETFFGLMGAFEPGLLGASWTVRSYQEWTWAWFEPDHPGQFEEKVKAAEAEAKASGGSFPPRFEENSWFNSAGKGGSIPAYRYMYIGTAPHWAANSQTRCHLTATLTAEGEPAFREFCLKLGRYMSAACSNEPVHYYQVTAEPEIPWGFKGSLDDLVRIYQIAYPALHEADPAAVVGGPAIGIMANDEVRGLLQRGLGQYIDVLDFHPYMGGDVQPIDVDLVGRIREFKAMVAQYAGKDLLYSGTESGYNKAGDTREDWLKKAWSDIHHNLILMGEGFWFNTSFHGADMTRKPGENTWGYYFNLDPDRDFGICKGSPKPVAPAYAALSFLLEGHKTAGPIEWLGHGTCGYAYERSNDVILALWAYEPREVSVPVGVKQVQVYDWMGNADSVTCPDGVVKLSLSREPQYIKGVSPALWGKNGKGKPLTLKPGKTRVIPGESVTIVCQLSGTLTKPISGQLVFAPAEGLGVERTSNSVTLKIDSRMEKSFSFTVPHTTKPGIYPLSFKLLDGSTPMAGAGLTLRVDPAISIDRVAPAVGKAGCGLSVSLTAAKQRAAKGKITVTSTDGALPTRELPFVLKPGQQHAFDLTWGEPLSGILHAALNIEAKTDDGAAATMDFSFDMIAAQHVRKALTMDGDLTDWADVPPLVLSGENAILTGKDRWKGPDDLSAAVRLAWDAKALYIACDVTDDTHWQRIMELGLSADDGVKVGINLDPQNASVKGSENVESGVLRRWHEFCVGARFDGKPWLRAGRAASYDPRFAPTGSYSQAELAHSVVRAGTHTHYEMAIPWSLLNREKPPVQGDTIGLALAVGDRDVDPGNEGDTWENYSALGLFGGVHNGRDIAKYGWVVLSGSRRTVPPGN